MPLSDNVKPGDEVYYFPLVKAPMTVQVAELKRTSDGDLYGAQLVNLIDPSRSRFESNFTLFDNLEKLVEQVEEDIEYLLQIAKLLRKRYWEERERKLMDTPVSEGAVIASSQYGTKLVTESIEEPEATAAI